MIKTKKIPNNEVFNVCSNNPINLNYVIKLLQKNLGKTKIRKRTLQKADVIKTHGCNKKINKLVSFKNYTNFYYGLEKTIQWSIKNKKLWIDSYNNK